jgi:DNA modification methylase
MVGGAMGEVLNKVPIVFRDAVSEIPSTTYGTFSIYKYPAKFIPQVVAYALKMYARPGMRVFDPFAGYGTVGLVAKIYGCDYELWDLNPLIDLIHTTATLENLKVSTQELVEAVRGSQKKFIPKWSNLDYWYPDEFIPILSRAWGLAHSLTDETKYALLIPLIKVTKYFSYADEKVHKLYKSKYSKKKIKELLKINWVNLFYQMLAKEINKLLKKIDEYKQLKPQEVVYRVRAGVDTLFSELEDEVNILVTSPPYLQAQEYIRSTKMELFWLGYDEAYIRELSKKEIPYRPVPEIEIYSSKYHELREKIQEDHLKSLYDRYFHSILSIFARLGEKVTNYMCIFVGPAKMRTTPVPIDDIIIEHLEKFGWKHEITLVDKIVSRVMFETKTNPASGIKDNRIETEHLVVLKK